MTSCVAESGVYYRTDPSVEVSDMEMELVVGISLASLEMVRKAALPAPIALDLIAQAAQGLDDAHDAIESRVEHDPRITLGPRMGPRRPLVVESADVAAAG